jgi:hypothetical protein
MWTQYEWRLYRKKKRSTSRQKTNASFVRIKGISPETARRRKAVSKEEAH